MREEKHLANFEDKLSGATHKEINIPSVFNFFRGVLPITDEHTRVRQSTIGLERKWFANDCWFRLITSIAEFPVVEAHQWHNSMKFK